MVAAWCCHGTLVLADLVRDLPVSSLFDFTSFPSNSGAGRRRSPTFCTLSAMAAPASSRTSCCCCWCRSSRARIPRPCSTPSTPAHSPTPSASRTSRETSSSSLPISAVASALVRLRLIYIVLSVQLWITCVVKKKFAGGTLFTVRPPSSQFLSPPLPLISTRNHQISSTALFLINHWYVILGVFFR